jgi:hypothetical protein
MSITMRVPTARVTDRHIALAYLGRERPLSGEHFRIDSEFGVETRKRWRSKSTSEDNLKKVAEAVLTPTRPTGNTIMAKHIVEVVLNRLDRRRFPWAVKGREPTEAERGSAVQASTGLFGNKKT